MEQLVREQFLPLSIEKSWDFFSNPNNLPLITPKELELKIQSSHVKGKIYLGDEIDYTVKPIFPFKYKWKTKIIEVTDKVSFTDKQIKGPYAFWEHQHLFEPVEGGTQMKDIINYKIPYGTIGSIFKPLIETKLNQIFEYRKSKLETLF